MKLLFDQNLSYKLVQRTLTLFPGSNHVLPLGIASEDDMVVWRHARENDFILVTQDADFYEISLIKGAPPKIIWLRCGNTSTDSIQFLLERNYSVIQSFVNNSNEVCLELF